MASLIISYYGAVERGCAKSPLGSETVTTSATSAQGAVQNAAVVASLYSDAAHYFNEGTNPTATALAGAYLPANSLVWVSISAARRIAAITA